MDCRKTNSNFQVSSLRLMFNQGDVTWTFNINILPCFAIVKTVLNFSEFMTFNALRSLWRTRLLYRHRNSQLWTTAESAAFTAKSLLVWWETQKGISTKNMFCMTKFLNVTSVISSSTLKTVLRSTNYRSTRSHKKCLRNLQIRFATILAFDFYVYKLYF